MTDELLALLSPEERAAWALCETATDEPWADMGGDGAFAGEVRSCSKFVTICRDPEMDERPDDRAFIANARTSLPLALTTIAIATLRADYRTLQERYSNAWGALCVIGEHVSNAGHYTLLPERALRVGDAVDALIAEVTQLRDHLRRQQEAFTAGLELAQRTADANCDEGRRRRGQGGNVSDINKILDAIEAGTVRIRWAHDDERALTEAQAMAADVRRLLVLLADTTHTGYTLRLPEPASRNTADG